MAGRAVPLAALAALLVVVGCTRRDTLTIAPATMSTTASAQNHPEDGTFVLLETASLGARLKFRSVSRWRLRITARAVPAADGVWPQLRVELDGMPTQTLAITDRRSVPYGFEFVAEPGMADLTLSLLGGLPTGAGPTLVIERVEIVPL
jgi:hypothetical protein